MRHVELLEKAQSESADRGGASIAALIAVIELHKPVWWNSRDTDIKEAYCAGCDNRCGCYEGDIMGDNEWETCPTIQAIEKELNG